MLAVTHVSAVAAADGCFGGPRVGEITRRGDKPQDCQCHSLGVVCGTTYIPRAVTFIHTNRDGGLAWMDELALLTEDVVTEQTVLGDAKMDEDGW
jgi:hypothetical protein